MQVILDAEKMKTAEEAHAYLKEMLNLPEYYGRNLDALYDCLTGMGELDVLFQNVSGKISNSFANRIIRVFEDAAQENTRLMIRFAVFQRKNQ